MKSILISALFAFCALPCSAQSGPILKVRVVYDAQDAASAAVAPLLIQKIAAQPKFFKIVDDRADGDFFVITGDDDCDPQGRSLWEIGFPIIMKI